VRLDDMKHASHRTAKGDVAGTPAAIPMSVA
jgi:hypothetical protein